MIETVFAHLDALVARIGAARDPLAQMRQELRDYGRGNHGAGLSHCGVRPAKVGDLQAEWLIPAAGRQDRRLVFLHGGGWMGGSAEGYRALTAEIAWQTRCPVLAVNYRLAPEHPFPAGFEDAMRALSWVERYGPAGGELPADVGLIGDSAGGNLAAAVVAERLRQGKAPPARLALLSPMLDLRDPGCVVAGVRDQVVNGDVLAGALAAYGGDPQDPRVSPAVISEKIAAAFPPTLIQVSAREHLRDQALAFAEMLWRVGAPARLGVWPDMPHVWQFFMSDLPEARQALQDLAEFLNA